MNSTGSSGFNGLRRYRAFRRRWLRGFAALGIALMSGGVFAAVDAVKVTTDKTVDSSSLETIVGDVIRLSGARTNDEKAIALYDYLHGIIFNLQYPVETGQTVGPLKFMNVYGWGLCGSEHTVLKSLFETAGFQCRYRGWSNPGHTTIEVNYDNKWHYFDVFLCCYFWNKEKTVIVGQDEVGNDPAIVKDAAAEGRVPKNSYVCNGDDPNSFVEGCRSSKAYPPAKPEEGWSSVTGRDVGYSPLLTLRAGETLRLDWKNVPGMLVSNAKNKNGSRNSLKCYRNDPVLGPILEHYGSRAYANGRLAYAPDFAKAADLADVSLVNVKVEKGKLVSSGNGSATFNLNLPYPYALCKATATFEGGDGKVFVSTDGEKTWTDVSSPAPAPADGAPSEELKTAMAAGAGDVTPFVRQKYVVSFKAEFSGTLAAFAVNGIVEHNRCVQPFLVNGRNVVTVSTRDNKLPEGTALVVTYAYQEATAPGKRARFEGKDITYGEEKKVVKEATKLPCTFEMDVGGNTPPKMLYVERALMAK
ncbi:MAG: hypothetical protein V1809_16185 [Planctomycetota bacterium]